ncbi:sigma-70 family RNA polymerase sigma factor [Spirosoma sp. HMF4905]|uniref:Sigma-70 family RNA polymerase sigma factor n=1 Tax=Spirosoma arboris TaxID=2682092 RepID=A0A7K1SCX9_9BACT|nr:sigma-70 family RNA polymerase sigma factor [Spirosoma arboris]MVM31630.1 sigma-70 family RNA polymerase sigma factor [Spirosoma arboris]
MANLSDQDLVAHYINTGSNYYFAQIYTRHHQDVYRKCLFYAGNTADAEDFTQDIFVTLALKLKNYRREAKFTTWLHAITVNYCIDQLRKQKQLRTLQQSYILDSSYTSNRPTVTDEVYFQAFEQVINQLPPKQRDLLMAKYKAGIQINDIALNRDLTPSAVKMQLKRAREYARSLYDKILEKED